MNNLSVALVGFVMWLAGGVAYGQSHYVTVTKTVIGIRSCADWTKDKYSAERDEDDLSANIVRAGNESWLVGYASGVNMGSDNRNMLGGVDYSTLVDWTDEFCKNHPASDVTDAMSAMFKKLGFPSF